jgi:RNA polymerase sigma-70 factor (ECF subfamily)
MAEQPSDSAAQARRETTALSDAGLVIAIVRGHRDALSETYRRHGGSVYYLACRLFGSEKAEEVTREVFLALWRKPEDFYSDGCSLRSCLLAEAHGRGVDRQRVDFKCGAPLLHDLEQKIRALWPSEDVRKRFSDLPDAERKVIALAYFGGYTYRQLAALLHQPEENVKGNINDALRRLKSPR